MGINLIDLTNIWSQFQDYFSDWLRRTGGLGAYSTFEIDLSVAHDEHKYDFSGNQIIIERSDSTAYIKLNDKRNGNINTTKIGSINTPFNEFYVTNEANAGILEILVGTKGVFSGIAGRINAIITDPEDSRGNAHQVGNAELAVRLGSIDTYDKRGNVLLMDAFESSTLKWIIGVNGTHSAVSISTEEAMQGDSSCKLTSGTTGFRFASITKYIHPQISGKIGAEFSFTAVPQTQDIILSFSHSDGTTEYFYTITYEHDNSKLKFNGTEIATGYKLEDGFVTFHTMKFVFDSVTNKPIRLLINERILDISGIAAQSQAAPSQANIKMSISHTSGATKNSIYVDNIIITQNEP